MNILSGTDSVLYNIGNTRSQLSSLTNQLSSGLRINSAADDPSGLTIADNLQTRAAGFQQAVQNVQSGTNMLTVADGVASTIQSILQRINSLVIEANSDINSNEQLESIQTEINSMLQEINTVSQNANFNGLKLFDGSHDTYVANSNYQNVTAVELQPPTLINGDESSGDTVSNPQNPAGYSGKLLSSIQEGPSQPLVPGLLIAEVTNYGTNPTDPVLGPLGQPGVDIEQILYSTSNGFANGKGNESEFYNAVPTNVGYDGGIPPTPNGDGNISLPSGINTINFNYPNLSQADVGVSVAYEIFTPQQSGHGTAININDGGQEGTVDSISLPTLSTTALQVAGISILRPTMVDDQTPGNIGNPTGVDQSNQYAAMDAQARVQHALDAVSSLRATLGAQMVATQESASDGSIASLNLTNAESSIRDLNVGQAVTQFTQVQILSSVGLSVINSMQLDAKAVTGILFPYS